MVDKRRPVTLDLMRAIKTNLLLLPSSPHDRAMLWCAFTLACSGALRVSEYTCPTASSFDHSRNLFPSDIQLVNDHVQLRIRRSKTDQFGEGYLLKLPATERSVCPVRAYTKFLEFKRHHSRNKPFFTAEGREFLTRKFIDQAIRSLLLERQGHVYSSHSFRIGAATAAAANGATEETIRLTGRWKGSTFARYVRTEVAVAGLNPY